MNFNALERLPAQFNPDEYVPDPGLVNAAEVAFALRQPLLIMGEPGTGKTRFAYKLAHELAKQNKPGGLVFADKPELFYTKTNAQARDLFYTYDALAQFQQANIRLESGDKTMETADFIELQALGKAIAMTDPMAVEHEKLRAKLGNTPQSTVVLIDEIDKAPRDFPNDILNEIENQQFFIRELDNLPVTRNEQQHIFMIMTSNSEKNLPDAFLRRCVFYHIPFPEPDKLLEIAKTQLGKANAFTDDFLNMLISRFGEVRKKAVRKPPATAELLAWLRILGVQNITDLETADKQQRLRDNLSILVKTKEDLDAVRGIF
ncbi:MAG: MoxR family ATPase [Saprospiraceae bacterium]|nr:MoxR family ATPase [Saprospiraceae bacterium]